VGNIGGVRGEDEEKGIAGQREAASWRSHQLTYTSRPQANAREGEIRYWTYLENIQAYISVLIHVGMVTSRLELDMGSGIWVIRGK